jgi:hypothetical protein
VGSGVIRQEKRSHASDYLLKKWHIVGASKLGLDFIHKLRGA